ncbi:MAG: hypothetical protein FWD70_02335 [Desulfuromonadales bacterium]|nr:hypothetical protein [Desulfuromonadales bacterium]
MGVEEDLESLENTLEDLAKKYERYFSGAEKRPPLELLENMDKSIRRYNALELTKTIHKFRFSSISTRFYNYKQYWTRVTNQIEEGTYSKDRFHMKFKEKLSKTKPELTPSEQKLIETSKVYDDYVQAMRGCHITDQNIDTDTILNLINSKREDIQQKYNCDKVEFKVVVEEGKPIIKARPMKVE